MKILIPLLFLTLGVNANEVVYGVASKSAELEVQNYRDFTYFMGTSEPSIAIEVEAGEKFEIGSLGADISFDLENVDLRSRGNFNLEVCVQRDNRLPLPVTTFYFEGNNIGNPSQTFTQNREMFIVGPCKIMLTLPGVEVKTDGSNPALAQKPENFSNMVLQYDLSYRITKPSAAGTTTSAPILLPPTQDAAKSWFVKLQVSSDLKAWDDVAPGQFLGSDTARFFRILTTEAE